MGFFVKKATGNSTCGICAVVIAKGEDVFGYAGPAMERHAHLTCVKKLIER